MKSQVVQRLSELITAAFGLVAALAWNDSIQLLFKELLGEQSQLTAKFVYAIIVTIIAVMAAAWIGKVTQKFVPPQEGSSKKQLSEK